METNIEYKQKYLKYKQKYIELKNLKYGGASLAATLAALQGAQQGQAPPPLAAAVAPPPLAHAVAAPPPLAHAVAAPPPLAAPVAQAIPEQVPHTEQTIMVDRPIYNQEEADVFNQIPQVSTEITRLTGINCEMGVRIQTSNHQGIISTGTVLRINFVNSEYMPSTGQPTYIWIMVEYDNGQFGIIRSDTIIGVNILPEELPPPDATYDEGEHPQYGVVPRVPSRSGAVYPPPSGSVQHALAGAR